jgi:EmrB/QacA subfamily drug resistance transporter
MDTDQIVVSQAVRRRAFQFLVPITVGCALFMQTLDSTVIATALPAIAASMRQNPIRLNLAITSYLMSLAVFIPISGWVADRFGARLVFRSAIVIFTLGSAFCGFSESLSQLVCARILQGLGGAMMIPVGRLLVLRSVPKSDLVEAMSYLTVPAVLGPVVGPPVGGFIVTYYSWRWIFFMNMPIGLLGIVMVTLYIEDIRETERVPLDLRGFVLSGLGLAGFVLGFETLGRGMLPTSLVVTAMVGGGVCAGLYLIHYRRIPYPIVDLDLMKIPTFMVATLNGGLARMGIGALPFLLAMLLQLVFGLTPFASGLITFSSAAGALLMKFTVGPIIRRFGFRSVLVGNGAISALIMMGYALFRPTTPYAMIILTLLIGGFFRSLQFTSLNTLTYADVPPPMMSGASTLASMAQQLFVSLGVSLAALLLHLSLYLHGTTTLSSRDFGPAFVITGLLSLLSSLLFLPMAAHAGAELSGHTPAPLSEPIETAAEID